MNNRIHVLLVSLLGFGPSLFAQPASKSISLVGTWEKVSSKVATASTFTPAASNTRQLKMFTSTHYVFLTYDPTTHELQNILGGRCGFTADGFTEIPEFASNINWIKDYFGKQFTFKAKFDGDTFLQSGQIGGSKFEEIWRRVSATGIAATTPVAGHEKEITLAGEAVCAKCALHQAQSCQLGLRVDAAGHSLTYFLAPDKVRQQLEHQLADTQKINWCATPSKVVATGVLRQTDGRPVLVASRLEQAP